MGQYNILSGSDFNAFMKKEKIYKGETIRGLTHVMPFVEMKFKDRATWQIENNYFPDAYKLKDKNTSIAIDVDSVKIEQDKFIVNNYFLDINGNKIMDGKEFPYILKIFVSKDGNKVKKTYEVTKVEANEIVLFIEDQTGDYLSEQVIYGKIDAGLRTKFLELSNKYSFNFNNSNQDLKKYVEVSNNVIEQLVKNGKIEAQKTIPLYLIYGFKYTLQFSFLIPYALGEAIDMLGNAIAYLKIPDAIWDTQSEKYVFDKQNLIQNFKISTAIFEGIRNKILQKEPNSILNLLPEKIEKVILLLIDVFKQKIEAFNEYITAKIDAFFDSEAYKIAGNIIDTLRLQEIFALYTGVYNGLIDFVASTISFIGDILKLPKALVDHLDEVLETIDNILEFFRNFDWEKTITTFTKIYDNIIKYFKNENKEDLDYVRIAYICGFAIAFIATLFIPYANIARVLSSIGKIGKFGALLADLLAGLSKGTKALAQAGKQGIRQMLKFINELLALFAKGGKQLEAFFEKIGKVIGEWFLKNKEKFGNFTKKIRAVFSNEGKTEEFFRRITKKMNLAGEEILSVNDLKKLRKLLKDTFDVTLDFVDQNPLLKSKLKDWTTRRVAGSFNMIEGVMYLRKSVTAYTVQHEMFHMKLWYKMTKEFPELQPLFQKTLGRQPVKELFHEEYVLAEFMKNPSLWKEADLLNDLNNINGLRRELDFPIANLEYYKKWNLEQELLKFK